MPAEAWLTRAATAAAWASMPVRISSSDAEARSN
jgi:hypothetical protein